MKTKYFKVTLLGSSQDLRTNRWRVQCLNCSKQHLPPTTVMANQLVECPKCKQQEVINYNNYDT